MSEPTSHQPRSLKLFKKAAPEVQLLVKNIMTKERQEQHKKNRTEIYQTLLQYVKESTP
jgi:uncharacterized SAM-binding protein YcdF (DUF218 family)